MKIVANVAQDESRVLRYLLCSRAIDINKKKLIIIQMQSLMALVRRIATEMMRHATSGGVELDVRLGEIVRRGYERPPRRAGCTQNRRTLF